MRQGRRPSLLVLLLSVYVSFSKNSSQMPSERCPKGRFSFSGCKGTNFPGNHQTFRQLFFINMQKISEVLTNVKHIARLHLLYIYNSHSIYFFCSSGVSGVQEFQELQTLVLISPLFCSSGVSGVSGVTDIRFEIAFFL